MGRILASVPHATASFSAQHSLAFASPHHRKPLFYTADLTGCQNPAEHKAGALFSTASGRSIASARSALGPGVIAGAVLSSGGDRAGRSGRPSTRDRNNRRGPMALTAAPARAAGRARRNGRLRVAARPDRVQVTGDRAPSM